ncbi:MAG: 5-bromo-4-chloroindolyl phosphate hydrolysis family protein [Lachnospiraceae bacterium]|nr:5-bromo-4-chloroindolyl phosphate hydrolysis family protein [Lachnospiraceae bacterium]
MTRNDWYEAGEQIKNLVQDAVDTGDFSQLGNTIYDVVNDAMYGIGDALSDNLNGRGSRRYGNSGGAENYGTGNGYGRTYGGAASAGDQTYRGSAGRAQQAYGQTSGQGSRGAYSRGGSQQTYRPVAAGRNVPGELGSKVMKYVGYGMGAFFGAVLAIESAAAMTVGSLAVLLGSGIPTGILFAGSMIIGASGQKRLGLSRRFRRYQEVIGTRTYCMIEELASGIGETSKFVQKDLKDMIRKGYFPVGYLDRKETLLITDQSTYQQYLQAEESYAKRQSAQGADAGGSGAYGQTAGAGGNGVYGQASGAGGGGYGQASGAGGSDGYGQTPGAGGASAAGNQKSRQTFNTAGSGDSAPHSPEHQALIDEGQKYIRYIRECNDRIPGEEVTAKLDRLELVVTRIFREAEKDPDSVSDLRKMMNYYLPTTRKLLDAYCDLEDQPVAGQNIATTRREIESALDTINTAFEKLLDDLYEEQAWDISSDISVLNSMLAQEGLTGKDFDRGK